MDNTNNWYQSTETTLLNSEYYISSTFATTLAGDYSAAMSFIVRIHAIYSWVLGYEKQRNKTKLVWRCYLNTLNTLNHMTGSRVAIASKKLW